MNDLRSPMEDRPYRPAERTNSRLAQDDDVMSTAEYYRSHFEAIRQSRWFPLASVCAAVLVFSGIVSYAYKQGSQSGVNATTPVVEATETAYKEKPANPGGMDVPFQDAIVFDQLQNKDTANAGETIESLLPPPEQPVATELAQAEQPAQQPTEQAQADTTVAQAPTAAPAAPVEEAVTAPQATEAVLKQNATETQPKTVSEIPTVTAEKTQPVQAPVQNEVVVAAPAPVALPTPTAAPAPVVASPKAAAQIETAKAEQAFAKKLDNVAPAAPSPAARALESGTYRVQLGAFRDEAAAHTAWSTFQKQFSPQLNNVTPDFPRADLGAKGVFYRVHGKNLSKSAADSICGSINATRSGSCMVTQ